MTREKKEILKKIEEMKMWIELDRQLGYGYEPLDAYDDMYLEIERLWDKLARLNGYTNREEMEHDPRQFAYTLHDHRI